MYKKNNGPNTGRSNPQGKRPLPRIKGVTVIPNAPNGNVNGNTFNQPPKPARPGQPGKRVVTANRGGQGISKSQPPQFGNKRQQPPRRRPTGSRPDLYPPRKRPSAQKEISAPNLTNSTLTTEFNFHRYKLTLEYDGGRFSGWQIQQNAKTIQGEILRAAIEAFDDNRIEVHGSGRTDAGVHAIAQVAHIDLPRKINTDIIMFKLNDLLPPDININLVEPVANDFHARKDAVSRSYIYQIATRRTALAKKYVWWIKDEIDVEKIKETLHLFLGMQNFLSFSDDDPEEKSTRVLVEEMRVEKFGNLLVFRIRASHFLWKMVRRVIGVLAEVGKGKMSGDDITKFLTSATRTPSQFTAPPSGLFLEKVYYENDELLEEIKPVITLD